MEPDSCKLRGISKAFLLWISANGERAKERDEIKQQ